MASLTSRLLQGILALPLFGLAVWLLWGFPIGQVWLAVLLLGLAALQWLRPTGWLIALPALLPLLDLAPWSGRLLLDEFDAVLAILAATALLAGHYAGSWRQVMRQSYLPLWLLGLATLVALYRGLMPPSPLDANAWSGYLTNWNALRVGRGVLWALLFAPLVLTQLARSRERAEADLTLGIVLGALGFGVAVLWERGFFLDLMTARNIYGLVGHWLNLAAKYRITGLFSQMHFGGAAVDGYIVLAWPFALLLLLKARRPLATLLAAMALGLLAYACLVTFTRTTYLAVGVGGLVALLVLLRASDRETRRGLLLVLLFALLVGVGNVFGFRLGGVLVLMATAGVLVGAGLIGYLGAAARLAPVWQLGGLGLLMLAGLGLALDGMLTSKYHQTGLVTALALVVPLIATAATGGWALGRWGQRRLPTRLTAVGMAVLVIAVSATALGLGGTRMQARMTEVQVDLGVRLAHWRQVIDLASTEPMAMLFGQGMGGYPAAYLTGPRGSAEGAYAWREGLLQLNRSKALWVAQRLPDWTPGRYRAVVRYRAQAGVPSLALQLARRPLLVQEWYREQANDSLNVRGDQQGNWQQAELWLDSTAFDPIAWYRHGFALLSLRNDGARGSVLEIDRVQLFDANGRDLLANGDFTAGGDRWFAFNDYDHLAWHPKNLFLVIWFDQGVLGLVAFALFLLLALARLGRRARRGQRLSLALLAAIAGFLVLGLTETLFDVPRLTLLFWLLAIVALYRQRQRPGRGQLDDPGEDVVDPDDAGAHIPIRPERHAR